MARHVVARVDEIPVGGRKLVTVRGRPIVVFNVAGGFHALYDRCPHAGGQLSRGRITGLVEASEPGSIRYTRQGEIVRCPWHGWEFDIVTGKGLYDRDSRVATYAVELDEKGDLVVLV
jgi:nitrite reductase/ring-hydroxylating ferredoxin subunit